MMRKKVLGNIKLLLLFALIFVLLSPTLAQENAEESALESSDVSINNVFLNKKEQLLYVTLSLPGEVVFNKRTATFYERLGEQRCDLKIYNFDRNNSGEGATRDTFSILFLLDYSGSMREENRLVKSKEAIIRTFDEIELATGSQIYFSAFHNDLWDNKAVDKTNIRQVLEPFIVPPPRKGKHTDLYRALITKTREMRSFPGKKVLVILSDGENDISNNPYYRNNPPFTQEDVFEEFRAMGQDEDFLVFPIGLGDGTDSVFLKKLIPLTSDTTDRYIYSESAEELAGIVLDVITTFNSDYTVMLTPECTDYQGETRTVVLRLRSPEIDTVLRHEYVEATPFGTTNFGIDISSPKYWLLLVLLGVFILGFLLLGLMYMVPFFKQKEFKRKFVVPYEPEPNKIKRDPITQDAFQAGDPVVVKCRQMTSLHTWQALGHCPNYPSCMEFNDPCPGSGGEDIQGSFFSQQGIFRILNWLWYGAIGGFLGWLFYALSRWQNFQWLNDIVFGFLRKKGLRAKLMGMDGGPALIDNYEGMVDNFLYGLFTGTFVILALTFAEELGQTRKFSIKRMLVRGLIGLVVSFIIFFASAVMNFLVFQNPFITQLVTWSVFGIAFGAILSINSSINIKRGIFGSVISVIVAFGIYYLIFTLLQANDGLQKLLSNLVLGGVLGALVVTIIAQLEDFELVYLSPSEYSGMVKPISKWLKKGMEIFVGTSSKCYVFIKWDDEFAQDKHCKLIYYGGIVYIIPLHETLVNGVIVPENQKTPLQNGDILQLGRYSNSKMQYKEKRSNIKT